MRITIEDFAPLAERLLVVCSSGHIRLRADSRGNQRPDVKSNISTDVNGEVHSFRNAVSSQCPFSSFRGDSSNTEMTALTRHASRLRGSPHHFHVAARTPPTNKRQRKKKDSALLHSDEWPLRVRCRTVNCNCKREDPESPDDIFECPKRRDGERAPRLSDPRERSDSECGEEGPPNQSRVERPKEDRKECKTIKAWTIAAVATGGDHRPI
jgi:hypothetical protein